MSGRDTAYRTVANGIKQYGEPQVMTDPHNFSHSILNRNADFHQCRFAPMSLHAEHRDFQTPTIAPFGQSQHPISG